MSNSSPPGLITRRSYVEMNDNANSTSNPDNNANNNTNTTTTATAPAHDANQGFDLETAQDIKHFIIQIYSVIVPVLICIFLVVWWVRVDIIFRQIRTVSDPYAFVAVEGDDTSSLLSAGLLNALIIIAVIVVVTIVFLALFWYGKIKIIFGVLIVTLISALGAQGGFFIWFQMDAINIPMDYVTFSIIVWNFTIVGLYVIFKHGPLYIQQAYLVIASALMAFVFTRISEWTTWVLLVFLVLWDLFAVLTPCGPLRLLIEASNRNNMEIPALLYSVTMIYFMANDPSITERKKENVDQDDSDSESDEDDNENKEENENEHEEKEKEKENEENAGETLDGAKEEKKKKRKHKHKSKHKKSHKERSRREKEKRGENEGPSGTIGAVTIPTTAITNINDSANTNYAQATAQQVSEEDDERNGLKLGLGDFVFYSVLVSRAALNDWTTIFACIIAVLMGLTATILLLAIYKKALPALPISLSLGLIFYFLTNLVVTPYLDGLQTSIIHI